MKEAEKILNQLQAVITETLPTQVGEALQRRLKAADDLEIEVENQKKIVLEKEKILDVKDIEIKRLNECIKAHNDITLREREVLAREEAVKTKEHDADLNELKYQLQAEKDKSQFAREIGSGLVRNTIYRKSVFDSENQAPYMVPDPNPHAYQGAQVMVHPTPINKNLSESQQEE